MKRDQTDFEGGLRVSLVVPVRNEADSLPVLIDSIQRQTHPPAEVILVDGGSTDGTPSVAQRLTADDPRFRVIEAGEATPGRGRNVGIAAAHNSWVALTDAGIRLEERWLEELVGVVRSDSSAGVVYGNYEPVVTSFFERCAALAYVAPKQERPAGRMRGPSTASMLIRCDVWEAAGRFPDLRAAEDLIFMERLDKRNVRAGWAPDATVWWRLQPTMRATVRRFILYSRHNVLAGRERYWHYGVARKYVAASPFLLLALLQSVWWLSVPVAGWLARTARSILVRSGNRSLLGLLNPLQFAGVGIILAALDLATFIGWAQAVLYRARRPVLGSSAENTEQTR